MKKVLLRINNVTSLLFEAVRNGHKSVFFIPVLLVKIFLYKRRFKGSVKHYLLYRYWEYEPINPKDHFSFDDNVVFAEAINNQEDIPVLRDKPILLRRLGDSLGREFVDLLTDSKEDFIGFAARHPKMVAKPPTKARGEGILVIEGPLSEDEAVTLRTKLLQSETTLVEEYVDQHPHMTKIHPSSVTVVKIHTLLLGDEVRIDLPPLMQFGTGNSKISHRGFTFPIDRETGVVVWPDPLPNTLGHLASSDLLHRPLPFFSEVKDLAIHMARLVPEMVFASWDIAITKNGPVVIEGNGAPLSFVYTQSYYYVKTGAGAKRYYDGILNYAKRRQDLTDEKITHIEDLLFDEPENEEGLPEVMLVLGSTRCGYRIEEAWRVGAQNPDCHYLVSGGNRSLERLHDEPFSSHTEAEFMRDYLLDKGVSREKIHVENKARSTAENIENALGMLAALQLTPQERDKLRVGLVTGGFHMKRTKDILGAHPKANDYSWLFYPAYGPHTQREKWQDDILGFSIVMSEYDKVKKEI